MKKCAVIGSINMDLSVGIPRFPKPGETLTGSKFQTSPGGKGANQAIALAKLGVPVRMLGRVGDDAFGRQYLKRFEEFGVDAGAVEVVQDEPTGVAEILVSGDGENSIVIVPGANALCDEAWIEDALDRIMDCDIFLLQLEIPIRTVEICAKRLHDAGKMVILDPAPAVPLSRDLIQNADIITPNETELEIITPNLPKDAGMHARIGELTRCGGTTVIHKRGTDGDYIGTKDQILHAPGDRVNVVDTTAAGDSFNAGLAAGIAMGLSINDAVRLANAVGALAVTAFGAQDGMPTMAEARKLMGQDAG